MIKIKKLLSTVIDENIIIVTTGEKPNHILFHGATGKGRKKIQVRWLAPIIVNADGEKKNIVTINKVDE